MILQKIHVYTLLLSGLILFSCGSYAEQQSIVTAPVSSRILSLEDMRVKYSDDNSHFADIEGINVHYTDQGQGPTLLLIHGTLGDLYDWDTWVDELKGDYRVIRLDLPGFGLTGNIANKNYSVERLLSLIDGLMDYLNAETFGIVGISYGGIPAFRYASTRRDRITSMILINSAGIQSGRPLPSKKVNKDAPKKNIFNQPNLTKADIDEFYQVYINDPTKRTPDFIQRKLDFMNIIGREEEGKYIFSMYERNDPYRVLKRINSPSLIMWGGGNKALDTETASLFLNGLENSCRKELVTFKSAGHYINVELPNATVNAAKVFLDKLKKQPCMP